ncbi:MAG: SDR family NAD(P)-dependent oxidoreductase [Acidobacteriota bacterium]
MSKVCLITGVGPGTGSALVERFVRGGYRVAMMARSTERLDEIVRATSDEEGSAHAYPCDVADSEALAATFARVSDELGAPSVVVHNAVAATFGTYLEIEPDDLRRNFEVNTMALLHLARLASPGMIDAGFGAILCTGNTSAYRGKPRFSSFAPTKAAQRILLESIARAAGPQGIHAAYVAIDAVIDLEWTRKAFEGKPDEFFCQPADIADECYRIAHQPKSAWSAESVIRPFGEEW